MQITIKPLSPALIDDYFDFFNNRAFTDNPPWGGCYCTGFQLTKEEGEAVTQKGKQYGGEEGFMRALQEDVVHQITAGILRGYLAYADGLAIGWCNANARANYPKESANGCRLYAPKERREKAVVCFEIAPGYRGKGVATALLTRVVEDARAEGFAAVEGYPQVHAQRFEWDYTGPIRLYEKLGFVRKDQPDGSIVMRKELE